MQQFKKVKEQGSSAIDPAGAYQACSNLMKK